MLALQLSFGKFSRHSQEALQLYSCSTPQNLQVVGVVDTGLDMDSCYFWDDNFLVRRG